MLCAQKTAQSHEAQWTTADLTADEERNAIADRCQIDTMASFQKRPADLSNWQYHFGQPLDRAGNLRNEFFGP